MRTFNSEHDATVFREALETARGDEGEATRRFSAAMKRGETVDDAVTYWIDHISTASAAGKAKMRRDAERRISPALGWMQVSEVTREDVQRAMTAWGEDVAPKTVRNLMGIVTPSLREAAQTGKVAVDPTAGIRLPRDNQAADGEGVGRALTRGEADILLGAIREISDHYVPLVTTLLWTGMRWGEAEAITIGDFHDDTVPYLVVNKAAKDGVGGRVTGRPKTAAGVRSISLPVRGLAAVRAAIGDRADRDALLFTTPSGTAVRNTDFRRQVWYPAIELAGFANVVADEDRLEGRRMSRGLRPHDLRHTHASWCVAAGLDLHTTQKRLGHTSIQVTVDRYGHLAPTALKTAVDVLDRF